VQEHATGDPAPDARRLVLREVDSGGGAQGTVHGTYIGPGVRLAWAGGGCDDVVHVGVAADPRKLAGDGCGRQHEVGDRCRALWHTGVLRGFRVLDERDAALRLDRPQAERAVRPGPRQDDGDGPGLLLLGQRPEQVVDGQVQDPRLAPGGEQEHPLGDRHVRVRRDHVHVVGPHPEAVRRLHNGHRRDPGQPPHPDCIHATPPRPRYLYSTDQRALHARQEDRTL